MTDRTRTPRASWHPELAAMTDHMLCDIAPAYTCRPGQWVACGACPHNPDATLPVPDECPDGCGGMIVDDPKYGGLVCERCKVGAVPATQQGGMPLSESEA